MRVCRWTLAAVVATHVVIKQFQLYRGEREGSGSVPFYCCCLWRQLRGAPTSLIFMEPQRFISLFPFLAHSLIQLLFSIFSQRASPLHYVANYIGKESMFSLLLMLPDKNPMGKERRQKDLPLSFLETVREAVQVFGVGESCGRFAQGDGFPRRTYPVTAR